MGDVITLGQAAKLSAQRAVGWDALWRPTNLAALQLAFVFPERLFEPNVTAQQRMGALDTESPPRADPPAAAISSVSIWPLCSPEIAAHSAMKAIGATPAKPRKYRARRPEETSVGLRSCSQGNDQAVLEILCSTPIPSTASPSRSPNAAARAASSADRRRELKRPPWQSRSNKRAVPPGAHRQGLRRPSRPASRPRSQIEFS
jgi:hypothetical protein